MTLFNIELSMTLGSLAFDPYRFLCLPPSRRFFSLLKHASRSSTFILAVHLELILICVMHEIFIVNLNSQFNLICKPSDLRHHICINSCLILFCLACLHLKLTSIYHMWQDLLYLRLCISISHLIHKIFTCHFESHHRSKQAFANIRAFISIMNTLLYFPFLVLLVTYTLYQWDKHACLQHMSHLF